MDRLYEWSMIGVSTIAALTLVLAPFIGAVIVLPEAFGLPVGLMLGLAALWPVSLMIDWLDGSVE